jgi:hypothetical protein
MYQKIVVHFSSISLKQPRFLPIFPILYKEILSMNSVNVILLSTSFNFFFIYLPAEFAGIPSLFSASFEHSSLAWLFSLYLKCMIDFSFHIFDILSPL